MTTSFWNLFRGIWQLRDSNLIAELSSRRLHLAQVEEIHELASSVRVSSDVVLSNYQRDRLQIEADVTIVAGTVLSFGDMQTGFGEIAIGRQTWIGHYNNLRSGNSRVSIGAGCLISQFCTLVASGHGTERSLPIQQQQPPKDRSGIRLGDDVWLGAGVTITPGVEVGTGAIIGAGSVVTKNVPEYEMWGGVPAKKIGDRK